MPHTLPSVLFCTARWGATCFRTIHTCAMSPVFVLADGRSWLDIRTTIGRPSNADGPSHSLMDMGQAPLG